MSEIKTTTVEKMNALCILIKVLHVEQYEAWKEDNTLSWIFGKSGYRQWLKARGNAALDRSDEDYLDLTKLPKSYIVTLWRRMLLERLKTATVREKEALSDVISIVHLTDAYSAFVSGDVLIDDMLSDLLSVEEVQR